MRNRLSCVQRHQVVIVDRGGARPIKRLRDIAKVTWGRKLNGSATASIVIVGEHCRAQAAALAAITPRRHEIVIYRDNLRVAEGPVTEIKYGVDETVIEAADILEYLAGTALSKWWPSEEDGGPALMTMRAQEIIEHELTAAYTMPVGTPPVSRTFKRWEALATPANILPFLDVRTGTVLTASQTLPFEMTLAEHLTSLGKSGLRFTAVGRSLIVWDSSIELGRTRTLSSADLGERANLYATSRDFTAVQHAVGGAGGDPEDLEGVGTAGFVDEDYWGAWTTIDTLQEESDGDIAAEVAAQANALYEERKDMKLDLVIPSGGGIRLGDSLTVQSLVPGVTIPVTGTVNRRTVTARYLLTALEVSEDSSGESVKITLATASEFGG